MTQDSFDNLDYLFDLRGYVILRNAVNTELLAELNAAFDQFPDLPYLGWWGNVQRLDNNGEAGLELQNIVEAGAPFEKLIDHPAWVSRLHRYCGEKGTYVDGLFIDELLRLRPPHRRIFLHPFRWAGGDRAQPVPLRERKIPLRAGEHSPRRDRHRAGRRRHAGRAGQPQVELPAGRRAADVPPTARATRRCRRARPRCT